MFKQHLLFLKYNKNIECIIGKNQFHICKTVASAITRPLNWNIPLYEPYIPRVNTIFYNCTMLECEPYKLVSLIQLTKPTTTLRHCFLETINKYVCEPVKYNFFKNVDKLLFLANNIPRNKFYLADCLLYSDGERVCHKKKNVNYSHAKLVDIGTIARPKENNILSQDELICEEIGKIVNCDINQYVPYPTGLKRKEPINNTKTIILKTGPNVIKLSPLCKNSWCGYGGKLLPTRRFVAKEYYEPPGDSVYRCYYAKKQQICKKSVELTELHKMRMMKTIE